MSESRREQLAREADHPPLVEHERAYVPISALEGLVHTWSKREQSLLMSYDAKLATKWCRRNLEDVLKEYGNGEGA